VSLHSLDLRIEVSPKPIFVRRLVIRTKCRRLRKTETFFTPSFSRVTVGSNEQGVHFERRRRGTYRFFFGVPDGGSGTMTCLAAFTGVVGAEDMMVEGVGKRI
jgi:hypothetical protein